MFAVHCPSCRANVLLDEFAITEIRRTTAGHTVRYRCWCGTGGTWHARRRHGRGHSLTS